MMIIYSRPNCLWCSKAKDLLRKHNQKYQEIMLTEADLIEQFQAKYPKQRTVPFILDVDGSVIGGYDDLVKMLQA